MTLRPSAPAATLKPGTPRKCLAHKRTPALGTARPETATPAVFSFSEVAMPPVQRPAGRPDADDTARRTREFVRLIATGEDFDRAAELAKIKPVRALAVLSTVEMRQLVAQTLGEAA